MKAASIKPIVAAFSGLAGALTSAHYGYVNMAAIAGFGSFLLTLAIQYSSLKIKIAGSVATIIGILGFFSSNNS